MRELSAPPASVVDPVTRTPNAGSFRGSLPRVDYTPMQKGSLFRLTHQKRWVYVAVASPDLYLGVAVAHLGYMMNSFVFAFDRTKNRVAVDRSAIGPTFFGQVSDTAGVGCRATFCMGATSIKVQRCTRDRGYRLEVEAPDIKVDACLSADKSPPAIGVVSSVPGGVVNSTEKRALLDVTGVATVKGSRYTLDGALAGYDYTNGYLARHTAWKWAFALGIAEGGARVGLNLVEGFVGEQECAVWVEDQLYPLAEGRFDFDESDPLKPWHVSTIDGAVDLSFSPGGMHHEKKNYGVVASKFIQPVGTYTGRIRLPGRADLLLDRVLGVTEDQDILW